MFLHFAILIFNLMWCWASWSNLDFETAKSKDYQNEWVVKVEGGPMVAEFLALQSGYKQLGPVLGFEDTYLWHKEEFSHQEKRGNPRFTKNLSSHAKIVWAEQQKIIHRHKRDHIPLDQLESEKPLVREKRLPIDISNPNSEKDFQKLNESVKIVERQLDALRNQSRNLRRRKRRIDYVWGSRMFNDELWDQEWYLQDTRSSRNLPKLDLNVLPLYRLGITGRGVKIAVLDDGLEYTHDDLRNNYNPELSYDVNEGDHDPLPRYESTGWNGHGTRCAGEIAMEADNEKCGVGVAFEASIGGIKLLDGIVNDRVEGEALGYRLDLVDIYTASWGPADDGRSLEAPGRLAKDALERGISQGRAGKGSIYVWASGNGGSRADDCGCDGYVASVYTIAVGSASQTGRFPWYGERCPATLATTYSSGAYQDQMIATTDLKNTCTTKHTGTSASAPLAAGILALALQVNEDLTWRDVQHLIVWTSEYSPLRDNPGWIKNSAGFWFNPRFGFGLMNAYALVTAGYNWTTISAKAICEVESTYVSNETLTTGNPIFLEFTTDGCEGTANEIKHLEHVQLRTNLKYTLRGALEMFITSASGTKVQLLSPRKLDDSNDGFANWNFMSVASWGENPKGTWTLEVQDDIGPKKNNGTIGNFTLILHGTKEIPEYMKRGPRVYNDEYNRIRKMNAAEPFDKRLLKYFLNT